MTHNSNPSTRNASFLLKTAHNFCIFSEVFLMKRSYRHSFENKATLWISVSKVSQPHVEYWYCIPISAFLTPWTAWLPLKHLIYRSPLSSLPPVPLGSATPAVCRDRSWSPASWAPPWTLTPLSLPPQYRLKLTGQVA